ncbi:MAG: TadE/TadG family type IV pilus assembly protein [Vulcanimicrobiaceae bacterium]
MTHPRASRGQALFETAIALPLFLLTLFGMLWAIRASALAERAQLGVRYAGVYSALTNPYESYSLNTLYSEIDGVQPPSETICDANQDITNQARQNFWQPAVADSPIACSATLTPITGLSSNDDSILLQDELNQITVDAPPGNDYVDLGITLTSNIPALQNYFRSPDLGQLAACTALGGGIDGSLFPGTGSPAPETAPTLLPLSDPPNAVTVQSCAKFTPPPPCSGPNCKITYSPPPCPPPCTTPPPTSTPPPPPPTTPPPSPPPPTATPYHTPRPTPTASPYRSPTPTPTPKPPPTPTPPPTPRPTPTPTPTPPGAPPGGGIT